MESEVKASACNTGDLVSIPGLGRSPREGNGNPLQYSCLENPMDRGAWWATGNGVTKSRTPLSEFTFTVRSRIHTSPYLPKGTEKLCPHKSFTWMFIAALFITAKTQREPRTVLQEVNG